MQRYTFTGGSIGHGSAGAATTRRANLLSWLRARRPVLLDIGAVVLGALDVALVVPDKAHVYQIVLSGVACLALVARRRFPATVALATIPGFLVGWSEIAGMIALGTVAYRYRRSWQTVAGALGIWCCRFVIWPPPQFLAEGWREHTLQAIYAVVVVGMPVAIGLFAAAREDLKAHIAELGASRARERALLDHAARADERNKIAREMHDVVSHQVTLIAMQASALQMASHRAAGTPQDADPDAIAATIRSLCKRTLDELRTLVGMLRTESGGRSHADEPAPPASAQDTEDAQGVVVPGRRDLRALVELTTDSAVHLTVEPQLLDEALPSAVSAAAYRTVQEALTNARKYAPGSSVAVSVNRCGGELRVEVTNGAGASPGLTSLPSGGHGLVGLRERAALLGGSLQAAPTITGGFRVSAGFPLPLR